MTTDIKKLLGILNTDEFDGIIAMYIETAKADLEGVGIASSSVVETDPLIYSAIVAFVLSQMDTENAELYANAYALQKDTIRHLGNYIG